MQKFRRFIRIVILVAMVLLASIGMGLTGAAPVHAKNRDALSEAIPIAIGTEQQQVADSEQIDEQNIK